jgi:NADH:ubiquinone oxidoreductase subunit C
MIIKNSINNVKKENSYNLINYLINILSFNFAKKVILRKQEDNITIICTENNLIFFLNFLKNHYQLQFKTLISITAVDYPNKLDRFEVNYFLLSYKLNTRLIIKINTTDTNPIKSITSIYSSAS